MSRDQTRPDDQPAVRQRMLLAVVILLIVLAWGVAHVMNYVSGIVLLEGLAAWLAIFFVLRFAFSYRTAARRKRRIKERLKARQDRGLSDEPPS